MLVMNYTYRIYSYATQEAMLLEWHEIFGKVYSPSSQIYGNCGDRKKMPLDISIYDCVLY
ncbi:MAG: hypothetical protein HXY43_10195 [Fischerella sp.]|jgi:hypothetical protein|uniref:hypothetical protein n=1 Tax=Fischerella sp. TaxID=1191 RepID=UPI00180948E1|nr:hypothetical protein [Fischerella sp.]NWF59645.1 hypothetical protein [Fischerella sp.]